MKIGYFADGPWAHNALKRLLELKDKFTVAFMCVRFDRTDQVLFDIAKQFNIPIYQFKNINHSDSLNEIKKYNCDLLVSMSFNQIFKADSISLTRGGIVNCHAGMLPRYRGRNILNWALINDEKEFGITAHFVDVGIDTGPIILQRAYSINDSDNYSTLLERAYVHCPEVLIEALDLVRLGKVQAKDQKTMGPGMYCGQRREGDEIINWSQTSRELFNFIRAVCAPGPIALTTHKESGLLVQINSSHFVEDLPHYKGTPGQVIGKTEKGYLVKTLDSYLEILEVQSSAKIKVGDRFK